MFFSLRKGLFIGLALSLAIPARAEAIAFNFDWTGQIAGFQVSGTFGYGPCFTTGFRLSAVC